MRTPMHRDNDAATPANENTCDCLVHKPLGLPSDRSASNDDLGPTEWLELPMLVETQVQKHTKDATPDRRTTVESSGS